METTSTGSATYLAAALAALATMVGCHAMDRQPERVLHEPVHTAQNTLPRELRKTSLPTYTIEPPDILTVEALNIVPKPPYALRTQDVLSIRVQNTFEGEPIEGAYVVEPGGVVNLGFQYGTVNVAGLSPEGAQERIEKQLKDILRNPIVTVSLLQMAGQQQIAGQHLVGPDGNIVLGSYGQVRVVGMTLSQAKATIEAHLSQFLEKPEVAIDVFSYNSKVYYIITEGAGLGDSVARFPITGNETVLDAVSNVNGTSQLSSSRMWIARPSPNCDQVQMLQVDWKAITARGDTSSNYQLLPGDRLFIAEDKLVAWDTAMGKVFAPFERLMGFALLGQGTASRFSGRVLNNGRSNGGNFGTNF